MLAATMAEGGLLHAAADLVDHDIGEPDGVEVVHHHGRMPKRGDQRAGIPAPGIQRHHANLGQPSSRPSTKPAVHRGPGPVGHHIQQPTTLQIHQTGDPPGRRQARRLEEAGLIQPSAVTSSSRAGSSTSGRPCSATARITVCQPTPRSRATAATAWASLPTRRQASARARSVSTARGRTAAARSVQVRSPQAGSRQRQSRLRHNSSTGRPPSGRSRTLTVRRPWSSARIPQS
jgi:hypothetical protein